jgi:predicted TIM-barrel fold metal-dependent hydrolase
MREADLRSIIDSHHHLWELGRHPYVWLAPEAPPRPFGDHGALKRDYLLRDYLKDIDGLGVAGSVFVEANSGAAAAEIDWVDASANGSALPTASVGNLDLRSGDVKRMVSQLVRSPRLRGVRMSLAWHRTTAWRFVDRPDVMLSREFRDGLAVLTGHGLVYETVVMPQQLSQLADLARAHPGQTIVIDHLGTPWFETPADRAVWTRGMMDCATCPNMYVKLSALWTLDRKWRPDVIGEPVRYVVDLFGPERCMWASNLPVETLMCPVGDQLRNLEEVLAGLADDAKDWVFRRTAQQVYRID